MGLFIDVVAGFLASLVVINAVPVTHFPRGKTVVYKYDVDVKAGTIESVPYASQFALNGYLYVKQDVSDPALKNAYYFTLADLKYSLHNGEANHYDKIKPIHPLSDSVRILQDPFVVAFDDHGKIQGIKLGETETGWSRNLKQALASMMQIDLHRSMVEKKPTVAHGFINQEDTIHGSCNVAYDVHPKYDVTSETDVNVFILTKTYELENCTSFVNRVFNHVDVQPCHLEHENPLTTAARRVFEIENLENEILIRKLIGHSVIDYFPWQANSEAHYLLTNQSLILENVLPVAQVQLPVVNFENITMISNISYVKPQKNYALHAAEDITHGRHIVKLDVLMPKLKKMLGEAADYLEENHIVMEDPDFKHGQTINRLLSTMSYMDLGSFEQVYNVIKDSTTSRDMTILNIFLNMIPHVGTTASSHFIRNVIRDHQISDMNAILMLHTLPMYIRVPTEQLLIEMEDLIKFGEDVSLHVRKASILCFASLIYKTFQHHYHHQHHHHHYPHHEVPANVSLLLNRYFQHFIGHVKGNPSYEMKMVYLLAIGNIQIGDIHQVLSPIITGEISISDKPNHIRLLAMMAAWKSVGHDIEFAHDLYWPIMANVKLPLEIRIAAYNVLVHQLPHMGRLLNLHWFMVYEKNEHLYNYHYTTMISMANSVDPCLLPVREMARKILRFTKKRNVSTSLSSNYLIDYYDSVYGFGESLNVMTKVDELTGIPHIGYMEYRTSMMRKPVNRLGLYWNVHGLDHIIRTLMMENVSLKHILTNENVLQLLIKAAQDMPPLQNIHIELCVLAYDRIVACNYYDENTINNVESITNLQELFKWFQVTENINMQQIVYDTLYEMQVPTDIGLPAVLGTRIPNLMSIRWHVDTQVNFKIEGIIQTWRHGVHSMSIYNPIVDVWHTVQRVYSHDVAIPIDMEIELNLETYSLKVLLPRLPATKYSISGMLIHAKNYVSVVEDENDVLKTSCPTCHHHEIVTRGTAHKRYYQYNTDTKELGLQFTASVFDCETGVPLSDRIHNALRRINQEINSWNNGLINAFMVIRRQLYKELISPEVGTCGIILKSEPSIVHPTSHIGISLRANVEEYDLTKRPLRTLSGKHINIHGTYDVKAAATNTSVIKWDMNVNIDMSPGHTDNSMKVQLTKKIPGEKDLVICLDAHKIYLPINVDILKLGTIKDETNGKLTFSMGTTENGTCVRDDTLIVVTMKGELSDEQKKQFLHDTVHGKCTEDKQKSAYQKKLNLVPTTVDCIHEAILYTTLRKYTINITYKKVPQSMHVVANTIEHALNSYWLSNTRYTSTHIESGNVKITAVFPMHSNEVDVSVITPTHSYENNLSGWGDRLWTIGMDNTRFSNILLLDYVKGVIKLCSVHPEILITADNGTFPYLVPEEWVLVSGNYVLKTYAIFVKAVEGKKLALKMIVADHELEIHPGSPKMVVQVDGNIVENYEDGILVPADAPTSYAMRINWENNRLIIKSLQDMTVDYAVNSVSLLLPNVLQGQITGLCGHLDNTHKEKLPKTYELHNV
ncbi:uncharacterized protein LOC107264834 [Cephus cinctus]|uniref:Uncharacterized protein LOC107264834 n=1 Tax=Cephus cinctus TaxID=211228 RepID=A0AAJ7BLI3_CEPCN|nr:uncharacterized protein LOC107264834 [Cephus cinctus]